MTTPYPKSDNRKIDNSGLRTPTIWKFIFLQMSLPCVIMSHRRSPRFGMVSPFATSFSTPSKYCLDANTLTIPLGTRCGPRMGPQSSTTRNYKKTKKSKPRKSKSLFFGVSAGALPDLCREICCCISFLLHKKKI